MSKNRPVFDATLKLVLRFIPFFPAPELYELIRSVRRREAHLDDQIREAFESLEKSSNLIEDLSGILKEREQKLLELKAEYERVSKLATLTSAQAEAVAASLEKTINKAAPRERLIAFVINIAAGLIIFVLGVFAADWVKALFTHSHS
jgi:DNA-binding NarL/FixJ family response regulator